MIKRKQQSKIMTIFSISTAISMIIAMTNMALAQSNSGGNTTGTPAESSSSTIQVQAGGGNSTLPYTVFNPQTAQIKTGQSIMWYNPSVAPEPHTVTFALDHNTRPELSDTFAVKNSSNFMPIVNFTSQPVIIPNHNNPSTTLILASNSIASSAVVIDSAGKVKHLDNNAAYSVKGDEKLVNSGMLFPKGMGPPNGSTTFTLTFEKAGTYDYYCILHPWQKGK